MLAAVWVKLSRPLRTSLALAAVSASDELEESEQTEPSFIQLFTFVMASVCVVGGVAYE